MDTDVLVDDRLADGEKLIAELIRDGFDISVAFWVRTGEEGIWHLYLGSTSVQPARVGEGARVVYRCLSRIENPSISFSEIKLVAATDPTAIAAMEVRDRYTARIPTRYRGKRLGTLAIEEAFIYPRAMGPMTSAEVLQTILALMNRTGTLQSSTFMLADGTSLRAIPIGIQMRPHGGVDVQLRDASSKTERMISADEVVNIQ